MMTATFEAMRLPFREALSKCVEIVVDGSVSIVLPIVVLVMGVALASLLAQTGFLFAPKAVIVNKVRESDPGVGFDAYADVASIQGYLETILGNDDMSDETKKQFMQRCFAQSQLRLDFVISRLFPH